MSAQFDTSPQPIAPAACPLCGAPAPAGVLRCDSCGYHLAGVAGRAGPFSRTAFVWTIAGLALVYAITLAVVLAAR